MNVNYTNQISNVLKAGVLLSIVIVSFSIARSSFIIMHPEIASAVAFDLTISLPTAYLIFIRKTKISKLTVVPLFIFGIIAASLILPADNRRFLDLLKFFALPAVELGIFAYVGFIVYKSRKTYQSLNQNRGDFLENLRETLINEFPIEAAANALTFEIAGIYYAFFAWKTKRGETFFTYHRKNGAAALLTLLIFIIAVETIVLHLLIAALSATAAWILTFFSAYFLFQIYAHSKAIFLRPIEISDEKIYIRCGLIGDARIDLENIESINYVAPTVEAGKDAVKLSPLGKFTACNLQIFLRDEAVLNGIYGKKKNFKTIFLAVDEIEKFKIAIEQKLKNKIQEK